MGQIATRAVSVQTWDGRILYYLTEDNQFSFEPLDVS